VARVPELPEVERARTALERRILGRVIDEVDDADTFVCRPWAPGEIAAALKGRTFTAVLRTGKQIMAETDGPVLGLHLGMTGSFRFDQPRGEREERFARFRITFADGGVMVLRDPRRLARVVLDPLGSRLGTDALAVSGPRFRELIGRSRAPVKARLLDQSVVAGIGNLLADETLWRAKVHPSRRGTDLSDDELKRLYRAMRASVRNAVELGGSGRGRFGEGRRAAICPRDGATMSRGTVGGRTTYWCPREQT
jgi:formamidopyrimidine-DNA glycosylase